MIEIRALRSSQRASQRARQTLVKTAVEAVGEGLGTAASLYALTPPCAPARHYGAVPGREPAEFRKAALPTHRQLERAKLDREGSCISTG